MSPHLHCHLHLNFQHDVDWDLVFVGVASPAVDFDVLEGIDDVSFPTAEASVLYFSSQVLVDDVLPCNNPPIYLSLWLITD